MKIAAVQGCCCLALALMTGAVGAHWASVRQTVALAAMLDSRPATTPSGLVTPVAEEDPVVREARQILAEAKTAGHRDPAGAPVAASREVDARFERAVATFEQLVAQNAELKNQVAETNRDLMALQFQVDSHSESFRPLKISEEPVPMPSSSGVLPPKEAP